MIARQLISESQVKPLSINDSCAEALVKMTQCQLSSMPVTDGEKLVGIVHEYDIITAKDSEILVNKVIDEDNVFAVENEHFFEVLTKIASFKSQIMPVVDAEGVYIGLINQNDIIRYYAETYAIAEQGSIIVIETTKAEYSLSEVTRVIEQEGALIMTSFITTQPNSTNLLLTLKIDHLELGRIIKALERYSYIIHATFQEQEYKDDLQERYDMLMTYLNV